MTWFALAQKTCPPSYAKLCASPIMWAPCGPSVTLSPVYLCLTSRRYIRRHLPDLRTRQKLLTQCLQVLGCSTLVMQRLTWPGRVIVYTRPGLSFRFRLILFRVLTRWRLRVIMCGLSSVLVIRCPISLRVTCVKQLEKLFSSTQFLCLRCC